MTGILAEICGLGLRFPPIAGSALGDAIAGAPANAVLNVNRAGTFRYNGSDSGPTDGEWVNPNFATVGDSYWVRLDITAGTMTSGDATGSWLALSTDRSWTKQSTFGGGSVSFTVKIATDAAGANVVSTGSGSLAYQHTL